MLPKKGSVTYAVVVSTIIWFVANGYAAMRMYVDGYKFQMPVFLVTLLVSTTIIYGSLFIGFLAKKKIISGPLAGSLIIALAAFLLILAGVGLFLLNGNLEKAATPMFVGCLFFLFAFGNWYLARDKRVKD